MACPDPTPLFRRSPCVPVLTIERVADAVPLAKALALGGLSVIEVTLRTEAALEAAHRIAHELPDITLGIGTLTRAGEVEAAVRAGAKFLVSPGTTMALADALANAPVPALPGCATVSEAMALAARGFSVLKFFPAEASGGAAWLKAISAPLPDVTFCPTGGIDQTNAAAYLSLPNVVAVGGSWMAPKAALAAGDFARITELAREATKIRG
jgi:2-dehydro-3-deoxyphosphogluconate aldolase/(4S)-4-hydroxy-2-oxoglutarate aldolase